MRRVVIALGGNALLAKGDPDTAEAMNRAARGAAEVVADIAAQGWEVVVSHGNGPQVGRILLQQEAASRFVAPLRPSSIVEAPAIRRLVADGVIVIAAGGGGVPVVEDGPRLIGVEGVVDKDLASCILARDVEADALLILTDVEGVFDRFGTPEQRLVRELTVAEAHRRL